MSKEMRRRDRQLSEEQTKEVIARGIYGVLSLGGDEPYGVPLSYVYNNGCIFFHCALEGMKLDLLRNNNRAAFCVVSEAVPLTDAFSMRYDCAMAFGRVTEVEDAMKLQILVDFIDRYASDDGYRSKGREHAANMRDKTMVLKMEIERISGKSRR